MESEVGDDVKCGSCGYFSKPGYTRQSRSKGLSLRSCKFFGQIAHAEDRCLAYEKAEADLPRCENCGNSVFPGISFEVSSRFCIACREFGIQKLAEEEQEKQRKENEYLSIGLKIAALEGGGALPRCVAWCTWDMVAQFPEGSQTNSGLNAGTIIGGMMGGISGAMVGSVLGAAAGLGGSGGGGKGEPSYYSGKFGLLHVTDRELILIHLGRGKFVNYPMFPLSLVKEVSDSNQMVANRVCLRFPLTEIRPVAAQGDLVFSHKQQSHKIKVADLPEVAHQVPAETLLRSLREAGALPPVREYLLAMLLGAHAFGIEMWQRASTNDAYWSDLLAGARSEQLEEDRIFEFLRVRALSLVQHQPDERHYELLWVFAMRLSFEKQTELIRYWAGSARSPINDAADARLVLSAFLEKARRESRQSGWLSARKYNKLEALLSEVLS